MQSGFDSLCSIISLTHRERLFFADVKITVTLILSVSKDEKHLTSVKKLWNTTHR